MFAAWTRFGIAIGPARASELSGLVSRLSSAVLLAAALLGVRVPGPVVGRAGHIRGCVDVVCQATWRNFLRRRVMSS